MLLVLMHHQIHQLKHPERLSYFSRYLNTLKQRYTFTRPGETLRRHKSYVCLSFDDAYCDFYFYVFPLLKALKIPAILGIPTAYIQESTDRSPAQRLSVNYPHGLSQDSQHLHPLCTWQELRDMVQSPWVIPAAHGHRHANVTHAQTDLNEEFHQAKIILETQLNTQVECMIYPFGATSPHAHQAAKQCYRYAFRIGKAINMNWSASSRLYYRVDADPFWQHAAVPRLGHISQFALKYGINRLRGK